MKPPTGGRVQTGKTPCSGCGRYCTPEELALHDHGEYGPDTAGRVQAWKCTLCGSPVEVRSRWFSRASAAHKAGVFWCPESRVYAVPAPTEARNV